MLGRILIVNAGSSSLKLSVVVPDDSVDLTRTIPAPYDTPDVFADFRNEAGTVDAIGVRVVHGGDRFRQSARVSPDVLAGLQSLSDLAPLHNPPAITAVQASLEFDADLPVVACFDTTFHAPVPAAARTYAIPERWRNRWPLHRFGFHGLSHAYASRVAAQLMGREADPDLRLVTCHLGAGASLAAVVGGISRDTTMGFTPLDGLVMATRPGALDPGLVLWLCNHGGLTPSAIETALEHESGLLGLAGISDMQQVLAAAAEGSDRCILARDVYVHRLCSLIAAMTASMEGIDGIVFTGGVGEGSPGIRKLACSRLRYLGVELKEDANDLWAEVDGKIAASDSAVDVMVVAAREDLEIASEVRAVLA